MVQLIKYSLTIILFAGIITACTKEPDDLGDYSESFRFYFQAEMEGRTIEYYAGENDYTLTTDYSFEDNVVIMKGSLARENDLKRAALEMEIRGQRKLSSESSFNMNRDLNEGNISFSNPSSMKVLPDEFNVILTAEESSGNPDYLWIFEDENTERGRQVEKRFSAEGQSSFYTELTTSSLYCESYLRKDIHLYNNECDVDMSISGSSYLNLVASINSAAGIRSVEWFLNEESAGNEPELDLGELNLSADGNYYIMAVVQLNNDCVSTIARKVSITGGVADLCYTDFDYRLKNVTTEDPDQLGTARITYYDESGKEYSSYYNENSDILKIAAIKPFKTNEKDQATFSFLFEGEMTLINPEDSSEITLRKCFGNMAMAHP